MADDASDIYHQRTKEQNLLCMFRLSNTNRAHCSEYRTMSKNTYANKKARPRLTICIYYMYSSCIYYNVFINQSQCYIILFYDYIPVDPKPSSPLLVFSNSLTSASYGVQFFSTINWAILSPLFTKNDLSR